MNQVPFDRANTVDALSLKDVVGVFVYDQPPDSGAGYTAPKGSLLLEQPSTGEGKIWWKHGAGDTDWFPVSQVVGPPRFTLSYSHNGTLGNDWMGITNLTTEGRVISTKCQLVAMGFNNANSNRSVDIEIYKNGRTASELQYTWSIVNSKSASVQLVTPVQFAASDVIDVFGRDTGLNARDTSLDIIFESLD